MEAKLLTGNELTDPHKRQFKEVLSNMGFGGQSGQKAGNFSGNRIQVTFGSANVGQSISHGLKRVPTTCFPLMPSDKAGAVLQLVGKDASSITLSCNVAGATFTLYVE
jgi:hypothetical protein